MWPSDAIWHQAITWTNVNWSSVESSDIHIRAVSQEMPQPSISKICLKIACLKFHSNFPGPNVLLLIVPSSTAADYVREMNSENEDLSGQVAALRAEIAALTADIR